MVQKFSVFGFGVKLGAGLAVGSFLGLALIGGVGCLGMMLSPNKKEDKKEEEAKDAGNDTESK